MMNSFVSVELTRLLAALSMALDFTAQGLTNHHRRVAYIAVSLGNTMGLSSDQLRTLFCASSIHDIGAISFEDKSHIAKFEVQSPHVHCEHGYSILVSAPYMEEIATIIRHHHDFWSDSEDPGCDASLHLLSSLIHLADRIEVMLTPQYSLSQRNSILGRIRELFGKVFCPQLKDVLEETAAKESFWLDLDSSFIEEMTFKTVGSVEQVVTLPYWDLKGFAAIFARIIDSKSQFTHRHSRLVSASAGYLANLAGFTSSQIDSMEVAGLLHDLGKLSVPEGILEKPGALTNEEYDIIKRHTYYTYRILNHIPGFSEIAEWAAYHHERLDGKGYPFRVGADRLSEGSRIMAVADIFSALVEDRPYRQGLERKKVEDILRKAVHDQAIDGELTHLLLSHYDEFENIKKLH